jgi:hypothetical protein
LVDRDVQYATGSSFGAPTGRATDPVLGAPISVGLRATTYRSPLWDLSFTTRIVARHRSADAKSAGNRAGWVLDGIRVVAVVLIATDEATLPFRPTPMPPQMPWSRRWTAGGGGHRLTLLARLPKGWLCEMSTGRGARQQPGARLL